MSTSFVIYVRYDDHRDPYVVTGRDTIHDIIQRFICRRQLTCPETQVQLCLGGTPLQPLSTILNSHITSGAVLHAKIIQKDNLNLPAEEMQTTPQPLLNVPEDTNAKPSSSKRKRIRHTILYDDNDQHAGQVILRRKRATRIPDTLTANSSTVHINGDEKLSRLAHCIASFSPQNGSKRIHPRQAIEIEFDCEKIKQYNEWNQNHVLLERLRAHKIEPIEYNKLHSGQRKLIGLETLQILRETSQFKIPEVIVNICSTNSSNVSQIITTVNQVRPYRDGQMKTVLRISPHTRRISGQFTNYNCDYWQFNTTYWVSVMYRERLAAAQTRKWSLLEFSFSTIPSNTILPIRVTYSPGAQQQTSLADRSNLFAFINLRDMQLAIQPSLESEEDDDSSDDDFLIPSQPTQQVASNDDTDTDESTEDEDENEEDENDEDGNDEDENEEDENEDEQEVQVVQLSTNRSNNQTIVERIANNIRSLLRSPVILRSVTPVTSDTANESSSTSLVTRPTRSAPPPLQLPYKTTTVLFKRWRETDQYTLLSEAIEKAMGRRLCRNEHVYVVQYGLESVETTLHPIIELSKELDAIIWSLPPQTHIVVATSLNVNSLL